jgi:ABC-type nitrate/sulfonate/bicarbonate transport system substrate-binding protein
MRLRANRVQAPWPGPLARRIRPIAALSGGLAAMLVIAGCNPFSGLSSNSSSQTVTVAAVPGVNNANLYLAMHDGYFSRAGITVKIEKFTSVLKEITALDQGQVDVISADYGDMLWQQATAPKPIYQILADGYDAAPGVVEILTMPKSSVGSPANLAGQKIPVPNVDAVTAPMGVPTTLALASATEVLQSDGVNLAAVNWEPMSQGQEIDELVHGQVQAALLTGTGVYSAEQDGAVELVDGCSGPTSDLPLDGFFTTSSWVKEGHSDAAHAFQQGIYAADAAASMPGPIQSVLPAWISNLGDQEADLVTTGTYPLSTIVANVQRTAGLVAAEGMTQQDIDVSKMLVR